MDIDNIVIGGGVIGRTIALALAEQKSKVVIIDSNTANAGTKASGGHLKPSWFGSMPKTEYSKALELLDRLWGVHEDKFRIYPTKMKTVVYRVDTDKVLSPINNNYVKLIKGTVCRIYPKQHGTTVLYKSHLTKTSKELVCRNLIVATGVWVTELFPELQFQSKAGVSFRVQNTKLIEPFISPWAPYKQVVAHQQSAQEVWIGDGSAILESNWTTERTNQCKARCLDSLRNKVTSSTNVHNSVVKTQQGVRAYPVVKKDKSLPCLYQQPANNIWVVSGAGKNGTIAAGWAAGRLIHEIS
jgi:glycine/D-amino acid oxidase-like deaminating enzyme